MKLAVAILILGLTCHALALSQCEQQRKLALTSGLVGAFVPLCKGDGAYSSMQCQESVCYCADPTTGKAIEGSQAHVSGYDEIKRQCQAGSLQSLAVSQDRPKSECQREKERKRKLMGAFHPTCDEETGAYKVVQCREARCYCGDALSGEVDYRTSRSASEAKQMEKDCMNIMTRCRKQRYDAAQEPKLMGQPIPECASDGLYEKAQCRESGCYCVDEVSGKKIDGTEMHISDHTPGRCEKTECMSQTEVHNVPGKWTPQCDRDRGNFHPVQCRESVCFCVDRTSGGKVGKEVHVSQVGQLHDSCMTDCERLRDLGQKPKVRYSLYTDKPRCEANGDYHNVQCKEAECTCVDKNGQLNSRPKPIDRINQLERQCSGGVTECKQRRTAFRWSGCTPECSQYVGYGEALVVCCCD